MKTQDQSPGPRILPALVSTVLRLKDDIAEGGGRRPHPLASRTLEALLSCPCFSSPERLPSASPRGLTRRRYHVQLGSARSVWKQIKLLHNFINDDDKRVGLQASRKPFLRPDCEPFPSWGGGGETVVLLFPSFTPGQQGSERDLTKTQVGEGVLSKPPRGWLQNGLQKELRTPDVSKNRICFS